MLYKSRRGGKVPTFDGVPFSDAELLCCVGRARRVTKAQEAFLIECMMGDINGDPVPITRGNFVSARNLAANGLVSFFDGRIIPTPQGKERAEREFERTQ